LPDFAVEIGKALRRARVGRGLTLRQVAGLSQNRFKATSVAGYERGERTISVERFLELCDVYGISPTAVLGEIVRAVGGKLEQEIDLTLLEKMGTARGTLLSSFVRQIRAQRGEPVSETIVLREADLDVLATAAGTTREELAEALEPAVRREK
jgi:transcriptional regulator with XRE-family HTH domain